MSILIVTAGSISIMATSHSAMADQIGKVCVIFACGNTTISGESGSQPGPNTGTLIVTKVLDCSTSACPGVSPSDFTITVTGNSPSPSSFQGSGRPGTQVTLGAGNYNVDEERCPGQSGNRACVLVQEIGKDLLFDFTFSADCTSSINAGETKECIITNTHVEVETP